MDAQKQLQPAGGAPALNQETVEWVLGLLGEAAKGLTTPTAAATPETESQAAPVKPGAAQKPVVASRIEDFAATLSSAPALVQTAESRLKSSRLWTALGTIATLAVQNPLGLNLPPAAQLGIAGVAMTYIAFLSMKGGK